MINIISSLFNEKGTYSVCARGVTLRENPRCNPRTGAIYSFFDAFDVGSYHPSEEEFRDWLGRSIALGYPARTIDEQAIIDSNLHFHSKIEQEEYEELKERLSKSTQWSKEQ